MSARIETTAGYHQSSLPFLRRPHRISTRASLASAEVSTDLWELAPQDFPLFGPTGIVSITSDAGASADDGKNISVKGLDVAGFFQSETVVVGGASTTTLWRAPLAEIRLQGSSGDRTGAVGLITATVAGVDAAGIAVGQRKSHTGCREVPTGERWDVAAIGASLIREASSGQTTAEVTLRLNEARPNTLVDAFLEMSIGDARLALVAPEIFLGGSYFFVSAETSISEPIISAVIIAEVFADGF